MRRLIALLTLLLASAGCPRPSPPVTTPPPPATVANPAKPATPSEAAQLMALAEKHELGVGVPVDLGKAIALYRQACDGGAGDACLVLSELYSDGSGVPKDEGMAAALLEKGCRLRGPRACYAMAQAVWRAQNDQCCQLALLLRACAAGMREACAMAERSTGDEPGRAEARFQEQCRTASMSACSFVRQHP